MNNILIFWDSITQWVYLEKGYSWADKLKSEFHSYNNYKLVFNLGISWDTVSWVLNRFKSELIPRWDRGDFLIFAVWINDSHIYFSNEEDYYISENDFTNNISKLLSEAKKITNNIIFIWLTSVDDEITNPFKFSETWKCFSNNRINLFDSIIKNNCYNYWVWYIKMFDLLKKDDFNDWLHPWNIWQEKMYIRIRDYLNNLK